MSGPHDLRAAPGGWGFVALSLQLPRALLGCQPPKDQVRFARQSRQLANDDLNTAAMLGFRRFRQEYKAQSVPPAILTPGLR